MIDFAISNADYDYTNFITLIQNCDSPCSNHLTCYGGRKFV